MLACQIVILRTVSNRNLLKGRILQVNSSQIARTMSFCPCLPYGTKEHIEADTASTDQQQDPVEQKADPTGAYLVFDPTSNGTLFLVWSKTEVSDALAFSRLTKLVPNHKYTTNGGKTEIMRNLQSNKKNWFSGWTEYVKAVRMFDGEVKLLENAVQAPIPTILVMHTAGNEIIGNRVDKLTPGGMMFPLSNVDAVAAIPKESMVFDVKRLEIGLFCQKGNEIGAAMQFDPTGKNPVKIGTF